MKNKNALLSRMGLIILLLSVWHPISAQFSNPMETDPSVWNSRELMLIWGEANFDNNVEVKQAIFGVDYIEYLQAQTSPFEARVGEQTISTSVHDPGVRPMAVQAGDYDGDGEDELIYAVSESNGIQVSAPTIESVENPDSTVSLQLTSPGSSLEVYTGVSSSFTPGRGIPLLCTGDFDGDGQAEFALAARNSGGGTIVQLIDTDGTSTPNLRAQNHNETSVLDQWNSEVFDICSGDFDGDGDDEIALICLKSATGSGLYTVFLRVFDVTDEGCYTIVEKGSHVVDNELIQPFLNKDNPLASAKVSAQSIKNTETETDKLLVAFAFSPHDQGGDLPNFYMSLMSVATDLNSFSVLDQANATVNLEHELALDIKCGDLNGNKWDNAVVMVGTQFRIYSAFDDVLELNTISNQGVSSGDSEEYQTDNFEISDIDKNGRQNILHAYTFMNNPDFGDRTLHIKSVEFNSDYSPGTVIQTQAALAEDYAFSQFYFGLTVGNFDGDDLILGEPEFFECIYKRPLFFLAPPPIHFDHLDGVNYDESGCFGGSGCLFSASNTQTESSESTIKIEEKYDWNVSASATVGFNVGVASVGASMTAKYGEQFSNEATETNQQEIVVQNTTTIDDLIKGVRYPVHVYEYPVYNAAGVLLTYVTAAFPQYQEMEEYEEQGKLDPNYVPYYEPGNILSYPPIGSVDDFSEFAGGSALLYEGSAYTMTNNPGTSSTADISVTQVYGESGSQSWEAGVSSSVSASGYGMGFEASGEYNQGGLEVNSTTISGTEGFRIRYDNIGGPSGFNAYSVKPYIFWNRDGAGMLAYQVDPASSNTSPTWWDINYGSKSDPALMMPLRNEVHWTTGADPESPIFTKSKSMTFNRLYPNVGDQVKVQCRVHNFSLMATPGPVKVSFYNGNPADGGELVADINGETVFETEAAIPARGRAVVEMDFYMPLPVIDGETFVRFYAVLDPQDEYDEVHEENNMGWQTLGYDCEAGSGTNSVYEYYSKEQFTEMWVWPNPASDEINLAFNMASNSDAYLEMYDMQGRVVLRRDLGKVQAGEQQFTVLLPAVTPGLYFLQLNSQGFRKTHKVMIK